MFWKKKDKADSLLYTYEDPTACRRAFLRIHPPAWAPVEFDFGGRPAKLVDISAGGLACRAAETPAVGEVKTIHLHLPGERVEVTCRVKVLDISHDDVSHCAFLDINAAMIDAIHHYVLTVQKEQIRRRKEANKRGGSKS